MKLRMTFRDPWIAVWSAVSILLIVACTALGIGLFATSHANGVAKCVNDILATRAPLNDADHANERQKINGQTAAERDQAAGLKALITAKTPAEGRTAFLLYQRGVAEFETALDNWKIRDDAIAAKKKLAPLGRCA